MRRLIAIACALVLFFEMNAQTSTPIDAVHINSGNPAFPFPQFLAYKKGKNLGTHTAPGLTHADMEKSIREAYRLVMNRATYLPTTVAGVKYIMFNPKEIAEAGPQPFCSEGDGYALIAAALMGDKTTFNGLWMAAHDYKFKKVKRYLDCTEQGVNYLPNPLPGVYDRKIDDITLTSTGEAVDGGTHDSAADGDWDIAMGLVLAARQWTKSGVVVCGEEIDYRKETLKFMKALTDTLKAYQNLGTSTAGPTGTYYSGDIGFDGFAKSGNTFGEMTNWATTSGFGKPKFAGPSSQYFDYMGAGYFQVFADFLKEEKANTGTTQYDWAINQFQRARASTTWLLEKTLADGFLPYIGGVSVNGTTVIYDTYPTSTSPIGEDFRLPWRNLADYIWHGDPTYVWDPATHQIKNGTTDVMLKHSQNMVAHLNKPSLKTGITCQTLGSYPGDFALYDGPMVIPQGVSKTGANMGQMPQTMGLNWIHGVSGAAPVIAEDMNLAAYMYQQCEIEWDATPDLNSSYKNSDLRYEKSTPKYFHEFFRLIGMLTMTGNYYAPNEIASKANVKAYVSIDKTYGFPGDVIKYIIKYRNYGSAVAKGATLKFDIPSAFDFVSTTKGSQMAGAVTWNVGDIKGFESGKLSQTIDSMEVTLRVKASAQNGRYCVSSQISGSNFDTHISDEYPNNVSYTMERNCFDVVDRSLVIKKEADKDAVNPGDVLTYTVSFENSSKAGWLDGGRPGVKFTYGQNYQGDPTVVTKFDVFLRVFHSAHEPYINLKNYRVSYFLNETAIEKVVTDKTQLGWYLYTYHYYDGDDVDKMGLTSQKVPFGQDASGKKWNQRLIFKFNDDLISAPTGHLFQQTNNFHRIHKGTGYPFIAYLQIETAGLSLNYSDDWSFDTKNNVTNEKDANVSLVLPDNSDPLLKDVMTNKAHPYGCKLLPKNTDKILVEEFDGYGWRRILGNGPIPGREAAFVVVVDTLPAEVKWGGFNRKTAAGVDAVYNASCHCITWKKDALLVAEKGILEYWVTVKNASELGKACPIEFDIKNRAWVSATSESPKPSEVVTHVTCGALPPPKPSKTTMTKTADKNTLSVNDAVVYTVGYKQTQGTIASPNLNLNKDWTLNGTPTFSNGAVTFGGNGEYMQYDFSHGKNGTFDAEIEISNASSIFSFVFRNTGGSPKSGGYNGVGIQIHPGPWGMDKGAVISIVNGSTIVMETDGFKPYDATSSLGIMKLHVNLHGDTMDVWINKDPLVDAPTISGFGLKVATGYIGYYNDKITAFKDTRAFGGSGPGIKIKSWKSNFDSAFEVKLWDKIPSEISYVANSASKVYPATVPATYSEAAPKFVAADSISWKLVTGKTPLLYGDSVAFKFSATVKDCGPGFITNVAYADILGQPKNKIGAQSVSTCGTPPTCIPPTSVIAKAATVTVCENQPATLGATYTLGTATTGYRYLWRKRGIAVNPTNYTTTYSDFTFNKVTPADTGTYILRINDGTDDVATCYREVQIHLTLSPKPTAEIITTQLSYCTGMNGVTLTATSVPNATYQWFKRGVVKGTSINTLANADSGKYTVRVSFGTCADTSDEVVVTISQQGTLSISGDTILCPGDALELTATPANITWTLPDKTFSTANPLSIASPQSGYYKASLPSGTCSGSDSVLVIVENPGTPPSITVSLDRTRYCEGDTVTITSVPSNVVNPKYAWFVNNTLLPNDTSSVLVTTTLKSGDSVRVTITSRSTCGGELTTGKTIYPSITPALNYDLVLKPVSTMVCPNQTVKFEVSGTGLPQGILLDWHHNGQVTQAQPDLSLPISVSTTVYASVTTSVGCDKDVTFYSDTITVAPMSSVEPLVEIKSDRAVMCSNDKSVVFTVSKLEGTDENSAYQWLLNGNPIDGETNDTLKISTLNSNEEVSLLITSQLSCATKDKDTSNVLTITVQPSIPSSLIIQQRIGGLGCEGDTAYLTASHTEGTISWSNGAVSDQIHLTNWTNGTVISATLTSTNVCADPPVLVKETTPLNGKVLQPLNFDLTFFPNEGEPLCPGSVALAVVSQVDSLTYLWQVGNNTSSDSIYSQNNVTNNLSGTVVVSKTGCYLGAISNTVTVQKSFNFAVVSPVSVKFTETVVGVCKGEEAIVMANSLGDISGYDWYVQGDLRASTATNNTSLDNLSDGDVVRVVAKPTYNCPVDPSSILDDITVRVSDKPQSGFTYGNGTVYFCTGQDTVLTALETNSNFTYSWLLNDQVISQTRDSKTITRPGHYFLVIKNEYCSDTSDVVVQDFGISVKANADPIEFVPGDPVKASALVGNPNNRPVLYSWAPSQLLQPSDAQQLTFYPQETMFIKIQVSTPEGCKSSDSIQVKKVDRLFIPNAITPETGDQNASWDIKGTEAFPDIEVRVFNRWGSLVHEQKGYSKPWDGTLDGKPLPTGTYYYVLKHTKLTNPKVGDLTIVR